MKIILELQTIVNAARLRRSYMYCWDTLWKGFIGVRWLMGLVVGINATFVEGLGVLMMLISYCGGIGLIWTKIRVSNSFLMIASLHSRLAWVIIVYPRIYANKESSSNIYNKFLHQSFDDQIYIIYYGIFPKKSFILR